MTVKILSIDYGIKHVGFAIGNSISKSSNVFFSFSYKGKIQLLKKIIEVCDEWGVNRIIFGMPYNIDGTKNDTIDVSDKLVKLKVNHKLIKFVIDWQFNNTKPRTAKTKQRNEIRGSTKKIVPQKGGGGARHASKKAPLFVGGGVAHGPKGAAVKIKKIKKNHRF